MQASGLSPCFERRKLGREGYDLNPVNSAFYPATGIWDGGLFLSLFWLPCRGLQGSTYRQILLFLGFPAGGGFIWWLFPGIGALLNFGDWGKPVGCVATAGDNPNPETPFLLTPFT